MTQPLPRAKEGGHGMPRCRSKAGSTSRPCPCRGDMRLSHSRLIHMAASAIGCFNMPLTTWKSSSVPCKNPNKKSKKFGEKQGIAVICGYGKQIACGYGVGVRWHKKPGTPDFSRIPGSVEHSGFEPLTPTLPVLCATSCANAPRTRYSIAQDWQFVKGYFAIFQNFF